MSYEYIGILLLVAALFFVLGLFAGEVIGVNRIKKTEVEPLEARVEYLSFENRRLMNRTARLEDRVKGARGVRS